MNSEYPNLPFVGQIVDYYPNNTTRLSAQVAQVHASNDISTRPSLNLLILNPDGTQDQGEDIEPVNEHQASVSPDEVDLEGKWGFAHEFFLHIDTSTGDENSVPKGTECNLHVGMIESRI